jgi:putative glutamine amidotransferase
VSARPILGIACCNRLVADEDAQVVMTRYLEAALPYADAAALLIPARPDLIDADDVAARLDGLLLTGSPSNVDVALYEPGGDGAGPFDRARDTMTKSLIAAMLARGKPVFGICRGFQEINVAFGGTLRRDTAAHPDLLRHHAHDAAGAAQIFANRHEVILAPGGVLRRLYEAERLQIVSAHFQGADRLGAGLDVEARAPDGIVEAVSATVNGAPLIAVQWHPEWQAAKNPQSQAFFAMLGRALRGQALAPA